MQSLAAAVAAGTLLFAGSAFAAVGYHAEAKLAAPAAAPITATVSDVSWKCDGDACVGEAIRAPLDNPMRQCRKVAAAVGPLAAFEAHGLKMDAGDMKSCNLAAKVASPSTAQQ
jgi:hypothetical protein